MELKSVWLKATPNLGVVSIVPLWNWNKVTTNLDIAKASVSIVPLWNWNIFVVVVFNNALRLNRTFMELKWVSVNPLEATYKSQSYLYGIEILRNETSRATELVSIVPLWNWNTSHDRVVESYWRLNRTFMELKYKSRQSCGKLLTLSQSYLYGIEIP